MWLPETACNPEVLDDLIAAMPRLRARHPDAKLLLSTNGESNDVSVIDVASRRP